VDSELRRALEALLIVTTEPISANLLAQLLEAPISSVEDSLAELAREFQARGFVLQQVAGGYRIASHPDCAVYVERLVQFREPTRISTPALQTLAIVAYTQPISRAQIGAIRGVNPDSVVRTLQRRGLITVIATDPGPGSAELWGTTDAFLEALGLNSLAELPPLAELMPGSDVIEALEQGLSNNEPV